MVLLEARLLDPFQDEAVKEFCLSNVLPIKVIFRRNRRRSSVVVSIFFVPGLRFAFLFLGILLLLRALLPPSMPKLFLLYKTITRHPFGLLCPEALSGGRTPCLLDPILVPLGFDKFWSEQKAPAELVR